MSVKYVNLSLFLPADGRDLPTQIGNYKSFLPWQFSCVVYFSLMFRSNRIQLFYASTNRGRQMWSRLLEKRKGMAKIICNTKKIILMSWEINSTSQLSTVFLFQKCTCGTILLMCPFSMLNYWGSFNVVRNAIRPIHSGGIMGCTQSWFLIL